MNYTSFIELHPWVDLFLELFKGIMPTLVALLAIYINNRIAAKREKRASEKEEKRLKEQYQREEEKMKKSFEIEEKRFIESSRKEIEKQRKAIITLSLTNLQNNAIELNNMVFDVGKDFFNYLNYKNDKEKSEIYLDEYSRNIYNMMLFSRKLISLAQMEAIKIDDDEIISNKIFDLVRVYNLKLADVDNNFERRKSSIKCIEKNLDEAQLDMIEVSGELENEIMEYIKMLSLKIKKINLED